MNRYYKYILICLIACLCMGAYMETRQYGFSASRTTVTADDTLLDGTTAGNTFQFADKRSTATQIAPGVNKVQIIFYGTDAANEECDFIVWAYRSSGPALKVYDGNVILGTALRSAGVYYGDTITGTDTWATTVIVADSGNNRVCTLSFDALGCNWIYIEVTPAGDTVTSISAEIAGF